MKMMYLTEQMWICGCRKIPVISYFYNKRGIPENHSMTCGKCNSTMIPKSKKHYVKLPKSLKGKELTKWIQKNQKKYFLGKEKLLELKRSKTTFTTHAQLIHERLKKIVPKKIKTMVIGKKKIDYYGEVVLFKLVPYPTDADCSVAYMKGRIFIKTNTCKSILYIKKGVDPEKYINDKASRFMREI